MQRRLLQARFWNSENLVTAGPWPEVRETEESEDPQAPRRSQLSKNWFLRGPGFGAGEPLAE